MIHQKKKKNTPEYIGMTKLLSKNGRQRFFNWDQSRSKREAINRQERKLICNDTNVAQTLKKKDCSTNWPNSIIDFRKVNSPKIALYVNEREKMERKLKSICYDSCCRTITFNLMVNTWPHLFSIEFFASSSSFLLFIIPFFRFGSGLYWSTLKIFYGID